MHYPLTPQQIYQIIKEFPDDALGEISSFVHHIKSKYKSKGKARPVKLGGTLAEEGVDISESDIAKARKRCGIILEQAE